VSIEYAYRKYFSPYTVSGYQADFERASGVRGKPSQRKLEHVI
jgi:hypothetical protein